VQARLIQKLQNVQVGNEACLEIQIVNVGKEPVFLTKIENVLPPGFQIVDKPVGSSVEVPHLIMKEKRLDPLKAEEVKLVFRSFMMGVFEINPRIICQDEMGRQVVTEPEGKAFNVSGSALPDRVTTGYDDLDYLLLGGLPENYAVVVTSPYSDERELLIEKFLGAGKKNSEITFYITGEVGIARVLAEEAQPDFHLFVCNPRAEAMIKDLPNVHKLKGVESLTEIDIALTKSFRGVGESKNQRKRACIEIVSDVLLQHHAVTTRKWLSGVLEDFRLKGFTILAVVNPQMHPPDEVQAILGLFEGEIRISEKETEKGTGTYLRIRRMHNQRYLESEIQLTKEKLKPQERS
jgi:KaiC/GvpD/RAD55 family RecA-like ATPase